jgi:ATP-dependent Clp protease ATP-binding subunit ClpX
VGKFEGDDLVGVEAVELEFAAKFLEGDRVVHAAHVALEGLAVDPSADGEFAADVFYAGVIGRHVLAGNRAVLEGADVEVPVGASSKNAMVPLTTINTRNILFICGGAFPDLEQIIRERLKKKTSMGFSAEIKDKYDSEKNIMDRVTNDDLRKFGMIPEFIGRLPIICPLQGLDADMLVKILKEPQNAILKQYQKLLALDEVRLEFEDDALYAIAEKALEKDTGARALRSIIEEFMLDIMYEIPKDENIGTVTITRAYVEGKGGPKIEIRDQVAAEKTRPALLPDKESEPEG